MNSPDFDFDDTPAEPTSAEIESFQPAQLSVGRTLPNSPDAERGLLASIFADDTTATLDRCISEKLTEDSFYNSRYGMVYACILKLHAAGQPIDTSTVMLELRASPRMDPYDVRMLVVDVSYSTTTLQAGYFLRKVRETEMQRHLIRTASEICERAYAIDGDEVAALATDAQGRIQRLIDTAAGSFHKPIRRTPFDFALVKDGDPSILLGNRYVNRGDAFIIVSSSGMGKSSLSLQMAIMLALQLAPFSIKGNGCLRSLIIQSEDSDGDIAEVIFSMKHALKLTPEQCAIVDANVRIVSDRVNRGPAFLAQLKKHIDEFQADLVWINPLQAFLVGDVTKGEDLGLFLREGLNGLNKESKFAYAVMHHTTKPATGKDRTDRLWHEVMYDMAGGAELINWARAIISIRPDENEGDFKMVLAKRGRRAGARIEKTHEGLPSWEYTTTIPLRHSKDRIEVEGIAGGMPVIFWETREVSQDSDLSGKMRGASRNVKFAFSDYANLFPEHNSYGMEIGPLTKRLETNKPISKQALYSALKRWEGEGAVEIIVEAQKPMRYRKAAPPGFA